MKKKEKRLPVYLTEQEVADLLAVINLPRDRLMLQCCYYFGLRVSELVQLKASDINLKERVVTIRAETAKRKKERRIPIPNCFLGTIKQYLGFIGEEVILFDLTRNRVWQLVRKYSEKAGINKKVHPHTLRHSYATTIYQKSGDLKLVQDLLGHESMTTTSIYAHLDDASKRRGIDGIF